MKQISNRILVFLFILFLLNRIAESRNAIRFFIFQYFIAISFGGSAKSHPRFCLPLVFVFSINRNLKLKFFN